LDPSRRSDEEPRPATAGATAARASRFSFFTGRRTSPNNSTSGVPVDAELLNELERERTLRAKAEERAEKVDSEIEELSVQLFSQANEMVATERKARAKLEERIEILERKDKDKMARLDRLEKAVSRIDRVKAILNQPQTNGITVGGAMLAPPAR
jgi:predicted RNase H-like nuclease (RuvC/YqgF family)